jgi:hypothetical protein
MPARTREKYRALSDAAFVLKGATDTTIFFPLDNVDWEYQRFRTFAVAVMEQCSKLLNARPDVSQAEPPLERGGERNGLDHATIATTIGFVGNTKILSRFEPSRPTLLAR